MRELGALYRDLECGSTFQDFAVGVICQRGGLETSTTTTTPTTTSPATTTTDYSHHVELRGGSVGLTEAYGNVYAVNSNGYFGPVCDDSWALATLMWSVVSWDTQEETPTVIPTGVQFQVTLQWMM